MMGLVRIGRDTKAFSFSPFVSVSFSFSIPYEDRARSKPGERSSPRTESAHTLIMDVPDCKTMRKKCSLFKSRSLCVLF